MELSDPLEYLRELLVARMRVTDTATMSLAIPWRHKPHMVPEAKLILVTRGTMRYTIGKLTVQLTRGSILYRPAATVAEWMTDGDAPCELIYVEFVATRMRDTFRKPAWVSRCDFALERASFHRLRDLQYRTEASSVLESEGELKALLSRFFRRATLPESGATSFPPAAANARENSAEAAVRAAQGWLNENMAQPDALVGLADRVGLSDHHFRAVFRKLSGVSPRAYLTRVRIMAARSYLERSSLSVKEVARKVGYEDPFYFSRLYKKGMGRSPTRQRTERGRT